ncbi:Gcp-like domain-containing protein [Haematococcus lacustris]
MHTILGIESSCDDTAAAIVTSDGHVLGEALISQTDIHAPWGGVVPNLAMEAHKLAINQVVSRALEQAGLEPHQLSAVAVTVGPGLSLCLRVGVAKALELCTRHQLPLLPIHHMEAHALVARMMPNSAQRPPFPFLCLLVSGGHNLLVLVRGPGQYVQLGTTVDDALGEAFDKTARLLGLEPRPSGGAALEALASQGDPTAFKFAVPMKKRTNCDFSYAGLKTSVRTAIEAHVGLRTKADIAASFQHVATLHLVERVRRAALWARTLEPGLTHLVVSGGVACNQHIRRSLTKLSEQEQLQLVLPPAKWCTDNGVMVAWAGVER